MKTPANNAGRRSKRSSPRRPAKGPALPRSPLLSDSEIRALSVEIAERAGADRFISILMKAHDALSAGHIRQAERVLTQWRLKSFQTLASAVIKMAPSGQRIEAMNTVFEAELYCYETTFEHAQAFFAYCDQLQRDLSQGLAPLSRRP